MSLIGKTVSILDKSLLEFFYPKFVKRTNLFFDQETRVIYVGERKPELINYLSNGTKEFINTVGFCDIDLDVRENLISFVYAKHGKEPKADTLNILKGLSNNDFNNYIKRYWVGGVSNLDENIDCTIFHLYIAMTKSGREALSVYYDLLKYYDFNIIQSSVETFLEKVTDIKDVSASGGYTKVLNDFNSKHRKRLKELLYRYYTMREPKEIKLRWLLYQF